MSIARTFLLTALSVGRGSIVVVLICAWLVGLDQGRRKRSATSPLMIVLAMLIGYF